MRKDVMENENLYPIHPLSMDRLGGSVVPCRLGSFDGRSFSFRGIAGNPTEPLGKSEQPL
jgi:hypothetical protein